MNKKDQERIIREMLSGLEKKMIEALPKIPEDWDGLELRHFLNYMTNEYVVPLDKKRLKNFKNVCIVNNL